MVLVAGPEGLSLRCNPIAMVHVHSGSALLNHCHSTLLGVAIPTIEDTKRVSDVVKRLHARLAKAISDVEYPLIAQVDPSLRSIVTLLDGDRYIEDLQDVGFVKALIQRAVSEVDIFVRQGFQIVEVENVGAPYFIGPGSIPLEEILIMDCVVHAVRQKFPTLRMGVHILSCNELEVLQVAIKNGAFFVRSEATLFQGVRPEGPTASHSNMARFLYLRRTIRQLFDGLGADQAQLRYPHIWSDIQKKHTVFDSNLHDIDVWLRNIGFMKLEGVIVTGLETGSDVSEASLKAAREAVDKANAFTRTLLASEGSSDVDAVPVITGSGHNFEMYAKYADYIIVGTALKRGNYWENVVSEANVEAVMKRIRAAQV